MPRHEVTLKDPTTGIRHKYEGAALEYLLRGHGLTFASRTLEESYALVADTVDGKSLADYIPYFLILPNRARADIKQLLQHVDLISVNMSLH
jgi:hypothetical protein